MSLPPRPESSVAVPSQALARLEAALPLAARLQLQSAVVRSLHGAIIGGFRSRGRPPGRAELMRLTAAPAVLEDGLDLLSRLDLIVRNEAGDVIGAYPFTLEATPHTLQFEGVSVHAMCALDALAVAPVFGITVCVRSRCAMTGAAVEIQQENGARCDLRTRAPLFVGIHWQDPHQCAAHTICRDMVFVQGHEAAAGWQRRPGGERSLFELPEAVVLARQFFAPLLLNAR